jgi:hypothetical protein
MSTTAIDNGNSFTRSTPYHESAHFTESTPRSDSLAFTRSTPHALYIFLALVREGVLVNAGRATPGGSGDLERWGIYMGQMAEALGVAVQAKECLGPSGITRQ